MCDLQKTYHQELSRIYEIILATFGKMRKKETPKKGRKQGGDSIVTLEFASNIYAMPATMGTISVAQQPLCSRPVLSPSANTPSRFSFTTSRCFLSFSLATNSVFSLSTLNLPTRFSFSFFSLYLAWFNLSQPSPHWSSDRDEM